MSDKKITVISPTGEITLDVPSGTLLADVLAENGFSVPAACGRLGVCGKCTVRLISGEFENEKPDSRGMIRSCRAAVCSDAVIGVDFGKYSETDDKLTSEKLNKSACGIAVDIGTTTVSAAFLKNGSITCASALNPQSAYGADVISRIKACLDGKIDELSERIKECISKLIARLDANREAEELIISGNTVMLHIFCGISPESMGVSPFTPQFTDAVYIDGEKIGIPVKNITVLPSASAFIGSDTVAGIYALGIHKTDKRALLADLGTNGELVISDKGRLLCASTAAGPALEGACIECGAGGIDGAINKVYSENGKIKYTVIGNGIPTGICGAGLTDAVAVLLKEKLLDKSGFLGDDFYISENVYLTQEDIRQFQLAKSAIYSGISVLAEAAQIETAGIDEFYIAGGLGSYLNPQSAAEAGIIPHTAAEKANAAGNTSLKGALMCIGSPEAVAEMTKISKSCKTIDLGGNPDFAARFTENLTF